MGLPNCCPLTGKPGRLLRRRKPAELAESYANYLGAALPSHLVEKYFSSDIEEYQSESSGLRWYSPSNLGDGEYYSTLAKIYPWYYSPGSWDKQAALDMVEQSKPSLVIEIGSGSGWFLSKLQERGIRNLGVEINPSEVKSSREKGLSVYFPEEIPAGRYEADWLCLFQTVEHVSDPAGFLREYITKFNARRLLLTAPCFESILGHARDPLSWPPHHATAWSKKSFETLAKMLNFEVGEVKYSPLDYELFESYLQREGRRKLPGLPWFPTRRPGRMLFRLFNKLGFYWATRGHSIVVTMKSRN
jgi:SAM-dependent methyltransferase